MTRDQRHRAASDVDLGLASAPGPDIASSAARTGRYVWVSARLYEIVGGWATGTPDPRHRAVFAGAAGRFAWQAAEWRARLPRLREVDHGALIAAPSAAAVSELAQLADVPPAQRSDILHGVIARLDAVYRDHAGAASPVRDGPVLRSIGRVRGDLAALAAEIAEG